MLTQDFGLMKEFNESKFKYKIIDNYHCISIKNVVELKQNRHTPGVLGGLMVMVIYETSARKNR